MIKKLKGKFETNNPRKQEIKEYKRHGSELINDEKFMYTHKNCRVSTLKEIEFKSELGFEQNYITLTKEQSVISKITKLFAKEKISATTFCFRL